MTTSAPEKRRTRRCPIDFFVHETRDGEVFLHPAIDLSPDGVYILAWDDRLAYDSSRDLTLEFKLPSGEMIRTSGKVVHVDDHRGRRGLRVAFSGLPPQSRAAIMALVDETLDGTNAG